MSQNVIIALVVNLASIALPLLGIHIGSDQLTESLQTAISVVTGIVIYIEHKKVATAAGLR